MAGVGMGTGVKRKLSAANESLFDGEDRIAKRISPFHNTPIQKKEMKRRILKISMRKMREIDCPETFLRRSVLINNLARSLQDDLKDDKIWGRWDWAGDMEMESLPCRSLNPNPLQPRDAHLPDVKTSQTTCTLLTNTCSSLPSSSSGTSQWTLGTQAHWLSAEEDAHMTPSERERVTRDLTQSHDRLAATVESLTSFDNEFSDSNKNGHSDVTVLAPSATFRHSDIKDTACLCSNANQNSGNQMSNYSECSGNTGTTNSDSCLLKRDINKNQVFSCTGCSAKTETITLPQHYRTETYNGATITSLGHASPLKSHSEDSRYSDIHLEKFQCFDKMLDKDAWSLSCPSLDYVQDSGTTYLDMTSNSVCRVSTESSILDTLDSCIPCLQTTSVHSSPIAMDISNHVTDLSEQISVTSSPSNQFKCNFTTANNVSPIDVTSSTCLWNSPATYNIEQSCPLPVSPCPSPTGSCSAEADRSEPVTSLQYTNPDGFTSQSLRDFDVIYNNLVSVLIGGN